MSEKSSRLKLPKPKKPTRPNHNSLIKTFKIHVFIFILVNLFLFFLNFIFSPTLLWFVFPLFGWLVGLTLHSVAVFARTMSNSNKGITIHGAAYVSTNLLLVVINYVVNGAIDWSLFPLFFWGFGLAAHIGLMVLYTPKGKRMI